MTFMIVSHAQQNDHVHLVTAFVLGGLLQQLTLPSDQTYSGICLGLEDSVQ
jgi:hypothetical protein